MISNISVYRPVDVISVIGEKYKMSNGTVEKIQEIWSRDKEPTAFGIVNAITEGAKSFSHLTQITLEEVAGDIAALPLNSWKRFDKIAEQKAELL
jgi:hypothetical protein